MKVDWGSPVQVSGQLVVGLIRVIISLSALCFVLGMYVAPVDRTVIRYRTKIVYKRAQPPETSVSKAFLEGQRVVESGGAWSCWTEGEKLCTAVVRREQLRSLTPEPRRGIIKP